MVFHGIYSSKEEKGDTAAYLGSEVGVQGFTADAQFPCQSRLLLSRLNASAELLTMAG